MTDPLVWRALLALIDGQFSEADRLGAEAVRRNTADDRPGNLPFAWWLRAAATLWQQETEAAGEYARRSTEAALAVGDHWNLAYGHNMQGHVATARGDYAEARRHYQAGYAIREELEDPEGMGTGLGHLAKLAAQQGDWAEAERLYRRGLAIAREINDPVTTGNALNGLGMAASASGDYAAAGQHFAEGLRLMAEAGYMRLLFTLLVSAADWLLRTGRTAEAVGPLAYAFAHPASDHETRPRAGQLLATATAALPRDVFDEAVERTRGADPAELAIQLASLLTAPLPADVTPVSPPLPVAPAEPPTLVEPLTARELEVLRLIAAGHSNREIADELFLAVNTVRSYSQQIYGKLGVGSRTRAVARARELGLLT
jgi:LuxR family maltose regulon positive regulatory protein